MYVIITVFPVIAATITTTTTTTPYTLNITIQWSATRTAWFIFLVLRYVKRGYRYYKLFKDNKSKSVSKRTIRYNTIQYKQYNGVEVNRNSLIVRVTFGTLKVCVIVFQGVVTAPAASFALSTSMA
jgi:hypothetical protein